MAISFNPFDDVVSLGGTSYGESSSSTFNPFDDVVPDSSYNPFDDVQPFQMQEIGLPYTPQSDYEKITYARQKEDLFNQISKLEQQDLRKELGSDAMVSMLLRGTLGWATMGLSEFMFALPPTEDFRAEQQRINKAYPGLSFLSSLPGQMRGFTKVSELAPWFMAQRTVANTEGMNILQKAFTYLKGEIPAAAKRGVSWGTGQGLLRAGQELYDTKDEEDIQTKAANVAGDFIAGFATGALIPPIFEGAGKVITSIGATRGFQDVAERVFARVTGSPIYKAAIVEYPPVAEEEFMKIMDSVDEPILPSLAALGKKLYNSEGVDSGRLLVTIRERNSQIQNQIKQGLTFRMNPDTVVEIVKSSGRKTTAKEVQRIGRNRLKAAAKSLNESIDDIVEGVNKNKALGVEGGGQTYSGKGPLNLTTGNVIMPSKRMQAMQDKLSMSIKQVSNVIEGNLNKWMTKPVPVVQLLPEEVSALRQQQVNLRNQIKAVTGELQANKAATKASNAVWQQKRQYADLLSKAQDDLDSIANYVAGKASAISGQLEDLSRLNTTQPAKLKSIIARLTNQKEAVTEDVKQKLYRNILEILDTDANKLGLKSDMNINNIRESIGNLRTRFRGQTSVIDDIKYQIGNIERRIAKGTAPAMAEPPASVNFKQLHKTVEGAIVDMMYANKIKGINPEIVAADVVKDIRVLTKIGNPTNSQIFSSINNALRRNMGDVGVQEMANFVELQGARNWMLRRTGEVLDGMGPEGVTLRSALDRITVNSQIQESKWLKPLRGVLNNLNDSQRAIFADVVEGKVQAPKDDTFLKGAVALWRSIARDIAREGRRIGIKIENSAGKRYLMKENPNYFPHSYEYNELAASVRSDSFLQRMVDEGKAIDKSEARKIVERYMRGMKRGYSGNIEASREFDIPGWQKDPLIALTRYISKTAKRFEVVKEFGQDGGKLRGLVNGVKSRYTGKEKEAAIKYIDSVMSQYFGDSNALMPGMEPVYMTFRNLSTFKLAKAQLSNMGQTLNDTLTKDYRDTFGIIGRVSKGTKARLAEDAGVINSMIMREAMEAKAGIMRPESTQTFFEKAADITGWAGGKFLDLSQFSRTEIGNRVFSATAGKTYITRMATRLAANPADKAAYTALEELGINPASVILREGELNTKELLSAINKSVRKNQFSRDVMELPLWWTSPEGKFTTQFKNFSYNQSILLYDTIIKNGVMKGNLGPLINFISLYGIQGEVVKDIRDLINGKEQRDTPVLSIQRWLENIMYAGGLGLFTDYLATGIGESAKVSSGLEFVGGPNTVSIVDTSASLLKSLLNTSPDPSIEFLLNQLPLLGPRARQMYKDWRQ